jgi:hypothetical protein
MDDFQGRIFENNPVEVFRHANIILVVNAIIVVNANNILVNQRSVISETDLRMLHSRV